VAGIVAGIAVLLLVKAGQWLWRRVRTPVVAA
jgi:hypothetical protein